VRARVTWTIGAMASAGLVLALAWHFTEWGSSALSGNTITVRHSAGWAVTLPREIDGHDVVLNRTTAGFSVDPDQGAIARYRREAFVAVHPAGKPPPTAWYDVRWVRGGWVHYAVLREENGNGYPIFTLMAWRRCGGGYIQFGETDHSELATPTFEYAWAMIRGLAPGGLCTTL